MKFLKKHLLVFVGIVLYFGLCHLLNITCPIKAVIGIPCPTCGMTRAMISLFRADIKSYMTYNPMALPMIVAVLLFIHKRILGNKKWITWFMGISLGMTLVVYVIRFR